jgi:hypothetical protein
VRTDVPRGSGGSSFSVCPGSIVAASDVSPDEGRLGLDRAKSEHSRRDSRLSFECRPAGRRAELGGGVS